jgi:toxin HigB-1
MIRRVEISKFAEKQLRKVPSFIKNNLMIWITAVELDGLETVREVPGYHDEALKGARLGHRSIRLSRSYRAIYRVKGDTAKFVLIEEVSKHDY